MGYGAAAMAGASGRGLARLRLDLAQRDPSVELDVDDARSGCLRNDGDETLGGLGRFSPFLARLDPFLESIRGDAECLPVVVLLRT